MGGCTQFRCAAEIEGAAAGGTHQLPWNFFSSHYPFAKEIREAVDTECFDVVELPYNVYNRSLGEDGETDILKYIHEKDLGIVNMKAFNGNSMLPIYQVLREFVSIDYRDMLNFCLSNPYITSVDAGARSPEEIDADIAVALERDLLRKSVENGQRRPIRSQA